MSEIPEGATHKANEDIAYYKYINNVLHGWFNGWVIDESSEEWLELNLTPIKQDKEMIYTKEMHEADINPAIGSKVIYNLSKSAMCENKEYRLTKVGQEMTVVAIVNNSLVCLISDDYEFCDTVNNGHFKPIDTRTDTEKAIDDLADGISASYSDDQSFKEDAINMLNFIKAGKIHGITFTGDK